MASIFTRSEIDKILTNEALDANEKKERIFALHGRDLDNGYVTKAQAEQMRDTAVEEAKKGFTAPDPKTSDEYKALQADYDAYKTRQNARTAPEYADVKPKFFDAVYSMLDQSKPIPEQIEKIRKDFDEYFNAKKEEPEKPQFGAQSQGTQPMGETGKSFFDAWGYDKKFNSRKE